MIGSYQFVDSDNKVKPQANLKYQVDPVRRIWRSLQDKGFVFWSAVRDWSSVFQLENDFLVLHHFVGEEPLHDLIESQSTFHWDEIINPNGVLGSFFEQITDEGMRIVLPNQIFLEALERELAYKPHDYHYDSPKHKLSIWAFGGDNVNVSLHIELFFNQTMAPYGIRHPVPWPDLTEEGFQLTLFGDFFGEPDELNLASKVRRRQKKQEAHVANGEDLMIDEFVDQDKEALVDASIERVFKENTVVIVAYSGGKDSHYCLDKCVKYKLSHPECPTKLVVVSADTGVENVVFQEHIRNVKNAVETLSIDIPFYIVKPDVSDTFWVCLLGKAYAPPSSNFKWCVTRMKILPGRAAIAKFVEEGETVCQILGSRSSESTQRGASMERHYGESFYGQHDVTGIRTATPIRHLSARDVVTHLARTQPAWEGYGNYQLLNLYGSGAGGMAECPIGAAISGDGTAAIKSCSGKSSRFGCYTCSVVNDDSSLRNMMMDYEELEPYYRVRTLLKAVQDIRYGAFVGYQRKGKYRFEPGFGELTIQIRTTILRILKHNRIELQDKEVWEIYREVCDREAREGLPISHSFRDVLFSFLPYDPLFVSHLHDSILDPEGVIDRVTIEDKDAIDRIWAMMENGEFDHIKH